MTIVAAQLIEVDIPTYCPECGNTFLVRDSDGYCCEACGIWFISPAYELPNDPYLFDEVVAANIQAEIRINQAYHDDLDLFIT